MDYKKVLRLHFMNHLSSREIAESCGDCSKTTVNEFLKRFRENPELSYPLPADPADVTNEYIGNMLYKKPGVSADQLLYRDFNKEASFGEHISNGVIGYASYAYSRSSVPFFMVLGRLNRLFPLSK